MVANEALLDRITVEPGKMGGRPCARRMGVQVMDTLAPSASGEAILLGYDELEEEDITAAVVYAPRVPAHRMIAGAD